MFVCFFFGETKDERDATFLAAKNSLINRSSSRLIRASSTYNDGDDEEEEHHRHYSHKNRGRRRSRRRKRESSSETMDEERENRDDIFSKIQGLDEQTTKGRRLSFDDYDEHYTPTKSKKNKRKIAVDRKTVTHFKIKTKYKNNKTFYQKSVSLRFLQF